MSTIEVSNTFTNVVRLGRRVVTVITFTAKNDRIDRIHAVGNPAKLAHLR